MAIMLDNGLDNAIEAAAKLSDPSKRWVNLDLSQQLPLLHMVIRNPVEQSADTGQGLPPTTKTDARNHGLGMGNMSKLARQHSSTMSYDCTEHIFTLRVMVNISNKSIRSI